MNKKEKVPLPYYARQLWPEEKQFRWWVKHYIGRSYPHLKPVGVEGDKIICERKDDR